jgi:hypothetical protein
MKCECDECRGTGQIDCPDCDGEGYFEFSITESPPAKGCPNYDQLVECYLDAVRARAAARRLSELKPEHAKSYQRQLKETLEKIEAEAEQLRKEAA